MAPMARDGDDHSASCTICTSQPRHGREGLLLCHVNRGEQCGNRPCGQRDTSLICDGLHRCHIAGRVVGTFFVKRCVSGSKSPNSLAIDAADVVRSGFSAVCR